MPPRYYIIIQTSSIFKISPRENIYDHLKKNEIPRLFFFNLNFPIVVKIHESFIFMISNNILTFINLHNDMTFHLHFPFSFMI